MGGCPSGQRELTVNQPADAYGGSNPPPPTISAHIAQQVEHILGKNEVIGSSPIVGSPVFVTNAALPHAGLHKRDALHAA